MTRTPTWHDDYARVSGRNYPTSYINGGFQLGLPASFRVFGDKRLIFEPVLRYGSDGFESEIRTRLGLGLKFNF